MRIKYKLKTTERRVNTSTCHKRIYAEFRERINLNQADITNNSEEVLHEPEKKYGNDTTKFLLNDVIIVF